MWKMIVDKIRNLLRKKPLFSIQTVRLTIMGSFLEACSKRFLPGTHWSQGCNASSWTRVPSTVDATWSNSGKTICFKIPISLMLVSFKMSSSFTNYLFTDKKNALDLYCFKYFIQYSLHTHSLSYHTYTVWSKRCMESAYK